MSGDLLCCSLPYFFETVFLTDSGARQLTGPCDPPVSTPQCWDSIVLGHTQILMCWGFDLRSSRCVASVLNESCPQPINSIILLSLKAPFPSPFPGFCT